LGWGRACSKISSGSSIPGEWKTVLRSCSGEKSAIGPCRIRGGSRFAARSETDLRSVRLQTVVVAEILIHREAIVATVVNRPPAIFAKPHCSFTFPGRLLFKKLLFYRYEQLLIGYPITGLL
jgi:hypothetical protein